MGSKQPDAESATITKQKQELDSQTRAPSSLLQNLRELTRKTFSEANIFDYTPFEYEEEETEHQDRKKKSIRKIEKLEVKNTEATEEETTETQNTKSELETSPEQMTKPETSEAFDKGITEEKCNNELAQKTDVIAEKSPAELEKKIKPLNERVEKLDMFVKKREYDSFGVVINDEELDGEVEVTLPDPTFQDKKKADEVPVFIPLVADRKNYEKTMHKASSTSFEFALATEKALSKAFIKKPKSSALDLFVEFDVEENDHDRRRRRAYSSDTEGHSEASHDDREPAYFGSNTHELPDVRGTSHYVKFGFPGFVPCTNQRDLPRPDYTRVLSSSLWIGNVGREVTEQRLREKAEAFGVVKSLAVILESSYGFVRFELRRDAEAALKGLQKLNFGTGPETELKIRWAKGSGILKGNFSYVDGVSYVATSDIAPLRIPPEDLKVDKEIVAILKESDEKASSRRRRRRTRSRSKSRRRHRRHRPTGKARYKRQY